MKAGHFSAKIPGQLSAEINTRTPLNGGFTLKTGRKDLIDLLGEWQEAGVNHAALGIQFSQRPAADIIQELAEEVLPLFPSLEGVPPIATRW